MRLKLCTVSRHFCFNVYFIALFFWHPLARRTLMAQIAPITVHPAFEKAAAYFDLTMIHVPVTEDFVADMQVCVRV